MRTDFKKIEKIYWITGWIYDFSKIATIILIIGLITHYFLYSILVVRGQSMLPNFLDGDIVLVDKISYFVGRPERGDVVAMFFPGETDKRFIKRVIGLPGETIQIEDGEILINEQKLGEIYLPSGAKTPANISYTLLPGEYFVLGDNRLASSDSRSWGPVPRSFIVGKAKSIILAQR